MICAVRLMDQLFWANVGERHPNSWILSPSTNVPNDHVSLRVSKEEDHENWHYLCCFFFWIIRITITWVYCFCSFQTIHYWHLQESILMFFILKVNFTINEQRSKGPYRLASTVLLGALHCYFWLSRQIDASLYRHGILPRYHPSFGCVL